MVKMKLTIGKKIVLGYIPVFLLILIISIFTLYRLNQVNKINKEIITIDIAVNNVANELNDILLAQESYGQRYMILRSQDMLSLFWKRDQEFNTNFQKIIDLRIDKQFPSLPALGQYHYDYNKFFQTGITYLDSVESQSYVLADSLRRNAFNKQVDLLNTLITISRKKQMEKTEQIASLGHATYRTVLLISILGIILVLGISGAITHGIRLSIKTLKKATNFVSEGNFNNLPTVTKHDELGDLSLAFNDMAARLLELEEMYMDSSPLTRLPGGIAIENAVKKRIEYKEPFAFCMCDLDNFKPFNDRYGYSRGNTVIKNTAKIIRECCEKYGTQSDFIGHIGGDDFAFITRPDKYTEVCNAIIKRFDEQIITFYNPEDKEKGYILSKNRQGKKLTFPIMTISISAINSEKSYVENYIQVGEIIAELKKYAKTFKKSILVTDRRGGRKRDKKSENTEKKT